MAGEDFVEKREAQISAILNTFMYTGYASEVSYGKTLRQIVQDMRNSGRYAQGSEHYDQFLILENAVKNENEIGELRLQNYSGNEADFHSETQACVFSDAGKGRYLVYQGTGDQGWIDNGEGMTQKSTRLQQEAADYFDRMAERFHWKESDNVTISGHSKGGNKAQYVTLDSRHKDLIDTCYSMDGQGFSPEAIEHLNKKYGEENYQRCLGKMYAIRGENDYVSGLGIPIIPRERTCFVDTGEDASDFVGHHAIENMMDRDSGQIKERGDQQAVGQFAEKISEEMMNLPPKERKEYAMSVMQILEMMEGKAVGIEGQHAEISDIAGFLDKGLPFLMKNLIFTREGRRFLKEEGAAVFSKLWKEIGPAKTIMSLSVVILFLPGVGVVAHSLGKVVNQTIQMAGMLRNSLEAGLNMLREAWSLLEEGWQSLTEWIKQKEKNAFVSCDAFTVDLERLAQGKEQLIVQRKRAEGMLERLEQLRRELDFGLRARLSISIQVNREIRSLRNHISVLSQMSAGLEKVQNCYMGTERQIIGRYPV